MKPEFRYEGEGSREYRFNPSDKNVRRIVDAIESENYLVNHNFPKSAGAEVWDVFREGELMGYQDLLGSVSRTNVGVVGAICIKLKRGDDAQRLNVLVEDMELEE